MNRKKILFLLPALFGGGAERVFLHIINNINREKFTPILAVGQKQGALLNEVNNDVEVIELNFARARQAVLATAKIVRRLQPETVCSTLSMNFAAALAKPFFPSGTNVVLREANSTTAYLNDIARLNRRKAEFYRRSYQFIYRLADKVICQSDYMLNDVEKRIGIPRKKLLRIYNPVDFAMIDRKMSEDVDFFSEKGNEIRLTTAGRLNYQKGFDILIKAFAEVRKKNSNATLTILGEGEEESALKNLTRTLRLDNTVKFTGFQSNPYSIFKNSDIFVLPSRYEGFSNVIIEANACGIPVVATDCPSGNREVIREGFNGWFAENENADSLAETIIKAIGERENFNAEAIRQKCEARFAMEKILLQYEAQF